MDQVGRKKSSALVELWRQDGRWVLAIVALALMLRTVYLLQARGHLFFNHFADSLFYRGWALGIVEGQPGPSVFFQGPLYPYLLAVFYWFFGQRPELVLWFQVLMGSTSCGLIYLLGRLMFGRSVGLLAALMGVLYGVEIFYESTLLVTSILYTLNLVLLVAICWAMRKEKWYMWIIPGLLLGLSALGRANILAFLPLLLLGIILLLTSRGKGENRWLPAVLAVLLGVFLVIFPVTLRNLVFGHDLVLITSNMGLNFFVGNNPNAHGYYEKPKGLDFDSDLTGAKIAMVLTGRQLKPSGVSRFWLRRALAFVRAQPGAFLKLTFDKFLFFWNSYEIPQAEDYNFFKNFAPLLRWPLLGFSILGPLGLLGMALNLRRWRQAYFLLAFVLSLMAVTVVFFVLARFRLQVCSVLMVFAAYALVWLWRRLRAREFQHLALAVLALIPLALLVNRPHPALNSARDRARAHTYVAKCLWRVEGDMEGASRELERALSADPHLGQTYLHLSQLRLEQGRTDETIHLWGKALQADPQVSMAHLNIGDFFAEQKRWDEAIREYREEIEISPYSLKAYEGLYRALKENKELRSSSAETKSNFSQTR